MYSICVYGLAQETLIYATNSANDYKNEMDLGNTEAPEKYR